MQELLAEQFQAFTQSYARPPFAGLRANTLKITAGQLRSLLPLALQQTPWEPAGFWYTETGPDAAGFSPGKHPYHAAGLYYLQEPSAMQPAALLQPSPGETVLDLCAAPGGKTTQLAAQMQNQGLLVANEIHPKRAWELAANLERLGITHSIITNETPQHLADQWGPFFDKVLVDAPCSGEGMFRKGDIARQEWSPEHVASCALRQAAILEQAARMLKPGGLLVYSTCTFNPDENEAVIARFLQKTPQFEVLSAARAPEVAGGRPDWLAPEIRLEALKHAWRIWPHQGPGEGHFAVLLQNNTDQGIRAQPKPSNKRRGQSALQTLNMNTPAGMAFAEFCQEHLTGDWLALSGRLAQAGAYLYLLPLGMPDLSGLHTLHPGWWLGTFKEGQNSRQVRFEPAHALALGLSPGDCRQELQLEPAQQLAYLHGEVLPSEGDDGWVQVCAQGFGLGWGKRQQGRLKNAYPRGLRWV
jgi:NOL1/NOP2/sun family putative RNA methylase